MKTILTLILSLFTMLGFAATPMKISDYPNTNRMDGNFLLLLGQSGVTNWNITGAQFANTLTNFNGSNIVAGTIHTNQIPASELAGIQGTPFDGVLADPNIFTGNGIGITNLQSTNLVGASVLNISGDGLTLTNQAPPNDTNYWLSANAGLSFSNVYIFVGDSIIGGGNNNPDYVLSTYWKTQAWYAANPGTVTNVAKSGNTLTQLWDGFGTSTNVMANLPAAGRNGYAFVWVGNNDVYNASDSSANIISGVSNYWFACRTNGLKVIAFTITKKATGTDAQNSVRVAVNNFIRTATTNWNALVDADYLLQDPTDTQMYGDAPSPGLHPSDKGIVLVGGEASDVLFGRRWTPAPYVLQGIFNGSGTGTFSGTLINTGPTAGFSGTTFLTTNGLRQIWTTGLFQGMTNDPPDAYAYRLWSDGGLTNLHELTALDMLSRDLQASNLFTLADGIYPFVGSTSNGCAQNLVGTSYPLVFPASGWTYNSLGITGDGTGGGYLSGFTGTNTANKFLTNSASLTVVCGTEIVPDAKRFIGSYFGEGVVARCYLKSYSLSSGLEQAMQQTGASSAATNGVSYAGMIVVSRTNGTHTVSGWPSRALTHTAVASAGCSTNTVGILCSISGPPASSQAEPMAANLRFAWVGGGLTGTQLTNLNTVVKRFNSYLGRPTL